MKSPVSGANLRERLGRGIAWNLVGTLFNQGSTLLVNLVVANLLGRRAFGEYAILQGTLTTAAAIAQFATGYTATRYVAEYRSKNPETAGRILGLCEIVSIVTALAAGMTLALGAHWLTADVLRTPGLAPEMTIAAAVVPWSVVSGYLMGALAGLEAYPSLAKVGIVSGIVYSASGSLGAWAGGLRGVLVGLAASGMLQWFLLRGSVRRAARRQRIPIRYVGVWREREVLTAFALPAALSGAISIAALWLANAILARQPNGYEELAVYAAANNIRLIVLFLPILVTSVGMAVMSNTMHEDDGTRYRRVFWTTAGLTVASVVAGAAVSVLAGSWVLGLFGKSFQTGTGVLGVLMIAAVAEAMFLSIYQVVQSRAVLWLSFFAIVLPREASMVVAAWFLAPSRGSLGLAEALTIGRVLSLVVVTVIVARIGLSGPPPRFAGRSAVGTATQAWPG